MIFGFNTDIKVGKLVFHVQTEDRGEGNPTIDTTIYFKGRVLAKRDVSYREFFESPEFDPDDLKELVERHHKRWVEAVQGCQLEEMKEVIEASGVPPQKIKVSLLNPRTMFRSAFFSVAIGVVHDGNGDPAPDAEVRVRLKTDSSDNVVSQRCDAKGVAQVTFPMPRIGPSGAELMIEAVSGQARGGLRYNLKPKGAQAP